jgi:hypothetical protein
VLAYGATVEKPLSRIEVLALRVLADQLEHSEAKPRSLSISISAA